MDLHLEYPPPRVVLQSPSLEYCRRSYYHRRCLRRALFHTCGPSCMWQQTTWSTADARSAASLGAESYVAS